ncbi:hypothetical protein H7K45_04740 [Mycobacterium yunnanensis]|uniref:Uncharacterized protein n=1 Tax=Mycobacterium yunnanensis TaxID=368477 RepID=A0A9X3BS97_9MYCO|nr:hypothetical protein [Mycobacterium yunnanensis]MCV7419840.1 hypothetical protein [Mycobacterium yunnanensis]
MSSAKELASALVAELARRDIRANVSAGADEYACNTEINDIPVSIYFGTDVDHADVRWMATDDQVHRIATQDIDPRDLADRVMDTLINPA